jgi:hypothetical protein
VGVTEKWKSAKWVVEYDGKVVASFYSAGVARGEPSAEELVGQRRWEFNPVHFMKGRDRTTSVQGGVKEATQLNVSKIGGRVGCSGGWNRARRQQNPWLEVSEGLVGLHG